MRKDSRMREKIVELLRKHPGGLPITDVAKLVSAHRHTVTKYVYELVGADVIQIREIGTAKVCFLKEKFVEKVRAEEILEKLRKRMRKKGQSQILAAILILLLIPTSIIAAQNMTSTENFTAEQIDLCVNVDCEDSTATCPDGWIATCSNTCDPATGVCSVCTPDCTGHEVSKCSACSVFVENETRETSTTSTTTTTTLATNETTTTTVTTTIPNITNETTTTIPNETTTTTSTTSTTVPTTIPNITNETTTTTVTTTTSTTTTLPSTTTTLPSTTTTQTTTTTTTLPEPTEPEIVVEISSPEKVTRGETADIEANVTNVGSADAKNVTLDWYLPADFEIVSGDQTKNCGTIAPNSSCLAIITVQTSYSTELGKDEIKVVVQYET